MKNPPLFPDPRPTVEIRDSRPKLVGMLALGLLGTALGALLVRPALVGIEREIVSPFIAWVSLGGAVLFAVAMLGRLLRSRSAAIVLNAEGFLDRRIMTRPVAWSDIRSVRVAELKGGRYLVIGLSDSGFGRLARRPLSRAFGWGAQGMASTEFGLSAAGLGFSLPQLMQQVCITAGVHGRWMKPTDDGRAMAA